jgi:hypothetical protein
MNFQPLLLPLASDEEQLAYNYFVMHNPRDLYYDILAMKEKENVYSYLGIPFERSTLERTANYHLRHLCNYIENINLGTEPISKVYNSFLCSNIIKNWRFETHTDSFTINQNVLNALRALGDMGVFRAVIARVPLDKQVLYSTELGIIHAELQAVYNRVVVKLTRVLENLHKYDGVWSIHTQQDEDFLFNPPDTSNCYEVEIYIDKCESILKGKINDFYNKRMKREYEPILREYRARFLPRV